MGNLAYLSQEIGDTATALGYFRKSVEIRRKVLPGRLDLAVGLEGLAGSLLASGDYSEAHDRLQEAVDIYRKSGEDNWLVGHALSGLATAAEKQNDLDSARTLRERSVEILKKTRGTNSPYTASALYGYGMLLEMQGKYRDAKVAYEQARQIFENVFGPAHPQFIKGLISLSLVNWRDGDADKAGDLLREAARSMDREVNAVIPNLSFAEQRLFVEDRLPARASVLLSYAAEQSQLDVFYPYVFKWKGLLIELLRRNTVIAHLGTDPKYKQKVDQLESDRAQLAGWYHRLGSVPLKDWEIKNATLTSAKEELERELAAAVPAQALPDSLADLGLREFCALLRPNEAFVDIYQYVRYSKGRPLEARFAAVVMGPDGALVLQDLSDDAEIDRRLSAWKKAVFQGDDAVLEWASLREALWQPISRALPKNAKEVWISPDGELSRIPWHLFPSNTSARSPLLVSVVDSARELANLRRHPSKGGDRDVFIAGKIDFGRENDSNSTSLYGPLEATGPELVAVKRLAQNAGFRVTALSGDEPTKDRVRSALADYGFVHLATHGFFFNDTEAVARSRSEASRSVWTEPSPSAGRNPLVESGIALVGANVQQPSGVEASGLLTAEELVGTDLKHLSLLVLSACDTGRGTEVTGQGVLGLRASVMAAGARSMLISLWKVPDQATEALMSAFYTNLWKNKMPEAQALLQAQLAIQHAASGKYRSPLYWAGWVLAGEGW
jgi:CHAT domain-containing protein/Tfp pilus assembly protein PilF